MKQDLAAAIAAANATEVERAEEVSREPARSEGWGDFVVQLDNAGQALDLVGDAALLVVDGLKAAGYCATAVCEAASSLD